MLSVKGMLHSFRGPMLCTAAAAAAAAAAKQCALSCPLQSCKWVFAAGTLWSLIGGTVGGMRERMSDAPVCARCARFG